MYAFHEDRDAAIRAWAKGILPLMAGAELLIRSDWAERLDRSGFLEASEDPPREYAYPRVGEFLVKAGYLSGGERRQLTIIASFFGQLARDGETTALDNYPPYDMQLYELLPGVNHEFIMLTATAVLAAAGAPNPWLIR
jgi:hypothetical protein